jgi:predicted ABC-type ATPase
MRFNLTPTIEIGTPDDLELAIESLRQEAVSEEWLDVLRSRAGKHLTNVVAAAEPGVEDDNLYPLSGSHHTSQGRWFRRGEDFGFNPAQPRDKFGKWTTGATIRVNVAASAAKAKYLRDRGIEADTTDYSEVVAPAEFRRAVAAKYEALPSNDPAAHRAYNALAAKVKDQFDYMTKTLGVEVEVTADDPYPSIDEMLQDVDRGRLKVLATASTGPHPFFTNEQNDMFRAVHDYFGHAATGRDFNRHGERATYLSHARTFGDDKDAIRALFTETEAQNAYVVTKQEFGEQKVALLPDADVFYGLSVVASATDDEFAYNPSQPRDKNGRWSRVGGRATSDSAAAVKCSPSPCVKESIERMSLARSVMHRRIVREVLSSGNPPPHVTILGGGGGAGKSTIVNKFGLGKSQAVVNADDIKEKIPEYQQLVKAGDMSAAAFVHEESSKIAKDVQAEARQHGVGLLLDQVGSNPAKVTQQVKQFVRAGYTDIDAVYVTVPTQVAVDRATARAQRSGRAVPEAILRAAHRDVSRGFEEIARMPELRDVKLYDNTGSEPILIASGGRGNPLVIHDRALYDQFLAKGEE